jgi:enoyl-CoA hydratase/carnithine racemase
MGDQNEVLHETRGRAFWITINRSERRNAINADVIAGIAQGLGAAAADAKARAVVLTGVGDKAFCAGADLSRGPATFGNDLDEPTTGFGRLFRQVREFPLPIIARVNGACMAGGMGLMAMCDLAIAADHARFGLPEARVGVFPMQVLVFLRTVMLPRHLNALCLTGDPVDAATAKGMGLVNDVVPADKLDAALDGLIGRIAANSPVALRRGKYALAALEGMTFAQGIAFAESQIGLAARTEDAREGLAAFNERRPPRWTKEDGA